MSLSIIFLWENFGPMHVDRCEAVSKAGNNVIGLELYGRSDTYDWIPEKGGNFYKHTLFNSNRPRGFKLLFELIKYSLKNKKSIWFLCHYEWWEIFLFAFFLRLTRHKVFTMGCSKYDDWPRNSLREAAKRVFFKPYNGAIGSGIRSKDFFRFHGIPQSKIAVEYNTLSIERIRKLSGVISAPNGCPYDERYFLIVARLVSKKNLHMALDAYHAYSKKQANPRLLHICGNGYLESELKSKAHDLGIGNNVIFHGFVQTDEISKMMGQALALILPSTEEQFGNVVIEAQALGLPVLLSDVCGARDNLIRTAVNGFIFEPDNSLGLAWFMKLLSEDRSLWVNMCNAASEYSTKGDVDKFSEAVIYLTSN